MVYATADVLASPEPTNVLRAAITTAIAGHPGWELVKDYTSGAYTCRTWKCKGASNGYGTDFFVTLFWGTASSATASMFWACSEQFNATSNLLIRPCANPASTLTPEATWASAYGATGYGPSASQIHTGVTTAVSTVAMTYWIKVTKRGIFVKTSSDTYGTYAGLFEPLWGHPQEFPIWLWEIGDADVDGAGSVSRRPACAGISMTDAFAVESHIDTGTHCLSTPMGSLPFGRELYGGKTIGSRYLLRHANGQNGEIRGLAWDCLVFMQEADVARGDMVTVDGHTYVCIDDSASAGLWMDKDAD